VQETANLSQLRRRCTRHVSFSAKQFERLNASGDAMGRTSGP